MKEKKNLYIYIYFFLGGGGGYTGRNYVCRCLLI